VFTRLARVAALLRDPRVGRLPRFAVVAAMIYTVWPVDLLPDFMPPLIGWIDDVTLLWLSLRWLVRQDPSKAAAPERLEADPPR
jgi:uncharacterized membrane protein YkvA (DUF1232 family)